MFSRNNSVTFYVKKLKKNVDRIYPVIGTFFLERWCWNVQFFKNFKDECFKTLKNKIYLQGWIPPQVREKTWSSPLVWSGLSGCSLNLLAFASSALASSTFVRHASKLSWSEQNLSRFYKVLCCQARYDWSEKTIQDPHRCTTTLKADHLPAPCNPVGL